MVGRHSASDRRRTPVHRPLDPTTSADPRVRAVIAELRALPSPTGPRPEFRDELRMQLVAVAPRLISEGVDAAAATGPATRASARSFLPGLARRQRPVRSINTTRPMHKPVAVISGAFTVLVALLAGAVWLSSSARPGDPLYGLKRASENVQLQFTGGDDKGKQLLLQAGERAGEVTQLLSQPTAMAAGSGPEAAGTLSPHTVSLVTSTLNSADSDLRAGVSTLTTRAVSTRSSSGLTLIEGWTPSQVSTLDSALGRVPAGALHSRLQSSVTLVEQGDARARALGAHLGCSCQSSTGHDSLGPIPCTTCTSTVPGSGGAPAVTSKAPATGSAPTPAPARSSTPRRSAVVPATTAATAGTPTTAHAAPTSGAGPVSSATKPVTSAVTSLVPTLPTSASVPAPVTINSCGVGVDLGPVSVGGCPSS